MKIFIFFTYLTITITSFFFSLKAEDSRPSNCGKLLSTVMKVDIAHKKASLDNFYFSTEEFCDLGTQEMQANFDIILFDKNKKAVNQKSVFLNTNVIVEEMKNKNSTQFEKHQLVQKPELRIVKFAIAGKPEGIISYNIISKKDKTILGSGEVVIEKK